MLGEILAGRRTALLTLSVRGLGRQRLVAMLVTCGFESHLDHLGEKDDRKWCRWLFFEDNAAFGLGLWADGTGEQESRGTISVGKVLRESAYDSADQGG